MKYIYVYNNSAFSWRRFFTEEEVIENDFITHSREVSKKTINKEKENNNFLHIFKKHTRNGYDKWVWYATYCI